MKQKVVVTGLGAITPIGANVDQVWENSVRGTSGISSLDQEWVGEYDVPVTFAGKVSTPPDQILTRPEIKRNDPVSQLSLIAAREAFKDSGLEKPEKISESESASKNSVDPHRFAVSFATGIGGVSTLYDSWDNLREKGTRSVMPMTVPMLMANGPAAAVSLDLNAQAAAQTVVSACASGTEAIGHAVEMIRDGKADVVLAGGAEAAIHPVTLVAFNAMKALSTRNDDPEGASRPFDRDRDGFVMSEGAAALILETEEHATARGAHIYAEIAGTGLSADAHHITAPDPEGAGAARAMEDALEQAGLSPETVVHVNAHATSTPVGDVPEAAALHRVFKDHTDNLKVSATKSQTGHLLGAAGALEGVLTVKAIAERQAPVTINLENQDSEIDLNIVTTREEGVLPEGEIAAINNSFGFGGHNAVTLVKSYTEE